MPSKYPKIMYNYYNSMSLMNGITMKRFYILVKII